MERDLDSSHNTETRAEARIRFLWRSFGILGTDGKGCRECGRYQADNGTHERVVSRNPDEGAEQIYQGSYAGIRGSLHEIGVCYT